MVLAGADDLLDRLHVPAAERAAIRTVRSQAETCDRPAARRRAINRQRIAVVDAILADAVHGAAGGASLVGALGGWAVHPRLGWPVLAVALYAVYLFVGVLGAGMLVGLLEEGLFGQMHQPVADTLVETLIPFPLVQRLPGRRVRPVHHGADLQLRHRPAHRGHLLPGLQRAGGFGLSAAAGRHARPRLSASWG